jgi:glycerol 2-dehydrogenase (NADP+)
VVEHAVGFALKSGYKHIDTATAYENEREVGEGIKASGIPRSEIFLTTKLDNPDQKRAAEALEFSLKQLQTPYVDLCTRLVDLRIMVLVADNSFIQGSCIGLRR